MPYHRPDLPYANIPLPNSQRFENLSLNDRPPTGAMMDQELDYQIDTLNQLQTQIDDLAAGNIPGSDDPNNANYLLTTDGNGNLSWVLVGTAQLADQSVVQEKLGLQSVGTAQYEDGSIPNSALGPQCVGTSNYVLQSVGTNQITPGAINTSLLADLAVSANKLAVAAVYTGAVQNLAITGPKIANGAINLQHLAAALLPYLVPTGTILPYAGQSAPTGFFACNGSLFNRATDAALFAVIGTTFGAGDGSTTAQLPDLRGQLLAFSVNNSTNGYITTATANTTNIGGFGGRELNNLTTAQLPNFSLNYQKQNFASVNVPFGTQTQAYQPTTTTSTATSSIGSAANINNMPPFTLINAIIKR